MQHELAKSGFYRINYVPILLLVFIEALDARFKRENTFT